MLETFALAFKSMIWAIHDKRNSLRHQAVEKLAYQHYKDRMLSKGKDSNPDQDWRYAEELLKKSLIWKFRQALFTLNMPLIGLEKLVVEPLSNWFEQADIFRIFEKLSPVLEAVGVILIPIIIFSASQTYQEQQQQQEIESIQQEALANYLAHLTSVSLETKGDLRNPENSQARQLLRALTLTRLRDPNFNGKQKSQLIYFLSELGFIQSVPRHGTKIEDQPLISLESTNLKATDLSRDGIRDEPIGSYRQLNYDLSENYLSIFSEPIPEEIDKLMSQGIDLHGADLHFAYLDESNLSYANLSYANLKFSSLFKVDLESANLAYSDLRHSDLSSANLKDTQLSYAKLNFSSLHDTDLSGANFEHTDLTDAYFFKSKNFDHAKFDDAIFCRTIMPDGIANNRDCQ